MNCPVTRVEEILAPYIPEHDLERLQRASSRSAWLYDNGQAWKLRIKALLWPTCQAERLDALPAEAQAAARAVVEKTWPLIASEGSYDQIRWQALA